MTLGGSSMYVVSVVLPEVQKEFGISRADASLPYTLMMLGFGAGGGLLGMFPGIGRMFGDSRRAVSVCCSLFGLSLIGAFMILCHTPLDTLDKVFGRWDTTFAHFGGKHSAGKPKVHDSDLKLQSFNRFPAVPIRVTRLCQEISATGNAYNNVIDFTCTDGKTQGVLIVHGRFRPDPDNRQRFHVEFHCTELRPAASGDEAGLRKALGFDAEQSLKVDLKPPRLHSDVVYLDDEIRINIGGLGGLYLLRRSSDAPVSI